MKAELAREAADTLRKHVEEARRIVLEGSKEARLTVKEVGGIAEQIARPPAEPK